MRLLITAEERVELLLRTMADARVEWDGRSDGEGALLMPRTWRDFYMELEHKLVELRELHYPLWWHVSFRFRFGVTRLVDLPVTRRQRRLHLPPRTELVAGGLIAGQRLARVRIYQWSERVDDLLVQDGVRTLTRSMYSGHPERINLPPDLYQRALAEKLVAS